MTLLTLKTDNGIKRCTSKCHNAKGKKCNCICQGEFHGIGAEKAIEKAIKSNITIDKKPLYIRRQMSLI